MQKAMKQMGMKQEDIEASEVIIKCEDNEIVIRNPQVAKIDMMGQESFQISGDIEERGLNKYTEEDVETVKNQSDCSEEEAKEALDESEGNIAEAIIKLKKQ